MFTRAQVPLHADEALCKSSGQSGNDSLFIIGAGLDPFSASALTKNTSVFLVFG